MNNNAASPEDIYAIIVGIDIYDHRKDLKISGCTHSALKFVRWLLKYEIPPENIYVALASEDRIRLYSEAGLTSTEREKLEHINNLNPTSEALRGFFNSSQLIGLQKKNAALFFYWQGHGVVNDTSGGKPEHVLVTSNTEATHTPGFDIENIQNKFYFEFTTFTRQYFFIDACADVSSAPYPDLTYPLLSIKKNDNYIDKIKELEQYNLFSARIGEAAKTTQEGGIFAQCLLSLIENVSPLSLNIDALLPDLSKAQKQMLDEIGGLAQEIKFVTRHQKGETIDSTTEESIHSTSSPPHIGRTLIQRYNMHTSYVVGVAWEPNGAHIASCGGDGTVQVWDAETGMPLITYRGHTHWLNKANIQPTVYAVAWDPEGKRIVSAGHGTHIYVWSANDGSTLRDYQHKNGFLAEVYAVAWSPDGTRIVSACSAGGLDRTLHLWDPKTGQTFDHYKVPSGWQPGFSVLSVAWSPDGAWIAATCGDKTIRVWNTESKSIVATYRSRSPQACHIAWSPDSRYLASAHSDHTAQIWDTHTRKNVLTYYEHKDSVRYVAWSPDGKAIATASNDTTVHIWEPLTGKCSFIYKDHSKWVTSVAWSPNGTCIASASNDMTVRIWQAQGSSYR